MRNPPRTQSRAAVQATGLDIRVLDDHATSTVVVLRGELTGVNASGLRALVSPLTERVGLDVLVDLTEVTFVDAVGLGVLAASGRALRSNGGRAVLLNPSPSITYSIEIAGLVDMIWKPGEDAGGSAPAAVESAARKR